MQNTHKIQNTSTQQWCFHLFIFLLDGRKAQSVHDGQKDKEHAQWVPFTLLLPVRATSDQAARHGALFFLTRGERAKTNGAERQAARGNNVRRGRSVLI